MKICLNSALPHSAGNHKNLPAGRQGFTLIELLVVIAIIAILSTIGFTVCSDTSGDWPAAFKTALAPYMKDISLDPLNGAATPTCGG